MTKPPAKPPLPMPTAIKIAAQAESDPRTVRAVHSGAAPKRAPSAVRLRVEAALRAAGLLAALLLAQACAGEGMGQQLVPGTGGDVDPSSRSTGAPAGSTGTTVTSTGGQIGTGGASTIPGTGGNLEDAKAPAGPEPGADGGLDIATPVDARAAADLPEGKEVTAGEANGWDVRPTLDLGSDLSPSQLLYLYECGANYGETAMCPPGQMCAPSRYCQFTCTIGSSAPVGSGGCPEGIECASGAPLRWDFCSRLSR